MRAILPDNEAKILNKHIAEIEKDKNIQIVLAVVKRCDSYAEIPWKAFALSTVLVGFSLFICGLFFSITSSFLLYITAPFFAGIIFTLAAVLIPSFARFFLPSHRAEQEVKQYAESLFLIRELHTTEMRTGFLMLISIFEKRVFLQPDKGLHNILSSGQLDGIMKSMIVQLKQQKLFSSFEAGLNQLDIILAQSINKMPEGTGKNELPDDIIEERGS